MTHSSSCSKRVFLLFSQLMLLISESGKGQKKNQCSVRHLRGLAPLHRPFVPAPFQLDVWQTFKGFRKCSIWAKLAFLETSIFLLGGLHCVNFSVLLLFLFRQTWPSLKRATTRFVTANESHIVFHSRNRTFQCRVTSPLPKQLFSSQTLQSFVCKPTKAYQHLCIIQGLSCSSYFKGKTLCLKQSNNDELIALYIYFFNWKRNTSLQCFL